MHFSAADRFVSVPTVCTPAITLSVTLGVKLGLEIAKRERVLVAKRSIYNSRPALLNGPQLHVTIHATMNLLQPVAQAETVELYFLSQQARFKLIRESNDDSPNLRKLLAHANLVDLLADELQSRKPKPRMAHSQQHVIPETFQESGWQSANYDSSDDDDDDSSSSDDDDDDNDDDNEQGELIEIEYVEDHVAIVGQGLLSNRPDPSMSLKVHGLYHHHHHLGPCESALTL